MLFHHISSFFSQLLNTFHHLSKYSLILPSFTREKPSGCVCVRLRSGRFLLSRWSLSWCRVHQDVVPPCTAHPHTIGSQPTRKHTHPEQQNTPTHFCQETHIREKSFLSRFIMHSNFPHLINIFASNL